MTSEQRVGGPRVEQRLAERAMHELHKRLLGKLTARAAMLVRDRHDAEVAASTALEIAIRKFDPAFGATLETFARRILEHEVVNQHRSRVRSFESLSGAVTSDPEDLEEVAGTDLDPAVRIALQSQYADLVATVHRRIDDQPRLGPRRRYIAHGVWARFIEIGLRIGRDDHGVKRKWAIELECSASEISKARNLLREILEPLINDEKDPST